MNDFVFGSFELEPQSVYSSHQRTVPIDSQVILSIQRNTTKETSQALISAIQSGARVKVIDNPKEVISRVNLGEGVFLAGRNLLEFGSCVNRALTASSFSQFHRPS